MKRFTLACLFICLNIFCYDVGNLVKDCATTIVIGSITVGYIVFNESRNLKQERMTAQKVTALEKRISNMEQRENNSCPAASNAPSFLDKLLSLLGKTEKPTEPELQELETNSAKTAEIK